MRGAPITDKEGVWRKAEQPVAFVGVVSQALRHAAVDRHQPGLASLAPPDRKHAHLEVDIARVECECFADPDACGREETEEDRAGEPAEPMDRGKLGRGGNDVGDLLSAVDIRARASDPVRDQPASRHLMCRIEAVQPLREQPDHAEARGPGLVARLAKAGLPLQEKVGIDVLGTLGLGEGREAPQPPRRCPEVVAQAPADGQVAIDLAYAAHCAPSTHGGRSAGAPRGERNGNWRGGVYNPEGPRRAPKAARADPADAHYHGRIAAIETRSREPQFTMPDDLP